MLILPLRLWEIKWYDCRASSSAFPSFPANYHAFFRISFIPAYISDLRCYRNCAFLFISPVYLSIRLFLRPVWVLVFVLVVGLIVIIISISDNKNDVVGPLTCVCYYSYGRSSSNAKGPLAIKITTTISTMHTNTHSRKGNWSTATTGFHPRRPFPSTALYRLQ